MLIFTSFQVLQPLQSYLDQAMAKEYLQETEQLRQDRRPEGDINDYKSYCDILRDQRKAISGSFVAEQQTTVDEDFDYRPVKIPKKPDAPESFLSLRLKHDRALMSSKKSSR